LPTNGWRRMICCHMIFRQAEGAALDSCQKVVQYSMMFNVIHDLQCNNPNHMADNIFPQVPVPVHNRKKLERRARNPVSLARYMVGICMNFQFTSFSSSIN
jgi:hypothetical protein